MSQPESPARGLSSTSQRWPEIPGAELTATYDSWTEELPSTKTQGEFAVYRCRLCSKSFTLFWLDLFDDDVRGPRVIPGFRNAELDCACPPSVLFVRALALDLEHRSTGAPSDAGNLADRLAAEHGFVVPTVDA
ncbi:hypothetical protein Xcel_2058 [Xylanimonas cellulosilytica DSM 15894]|uniref:Uncharacterized protein n=1 Tax=Xylanimonas cellulosilytica (strain DSM 15894 / JCM 12276 / CECT 5975 / KCTC 9989 / LMG 20990 / NBRC 107835 / XIL07) TaxID=446471 RepID=D1BU63_XYLCX|nr:hypothetical protein [Xylanimonas cellulosilytica]ACZ31076.1 hypothetical protein Xcel_2058 [Xylanimonas cellulosilytica DSM 15894]